VISEVRPDVVLIARLFDAYQVVVEMKRRWTRPRLAVTVQAYEPHYLFDARLYREHIDLCVTSGEMIRDAAVSWSGLPRDRVVSIPGGVRAPSASPTPRTPGPVLRLGYVGRLDANQKRIFDLVPLLELLDTVGLKYSMEIVGTGPAAAELAGRLGRQIGSGRVLLSGWQTGWKLYAEIFPRLDVLVHLAFTEGVTIAPREAMAHGVVPVVSEFIGLRREGHFLGEVNALTFPVGDVGAAANCIRRLAEEPGLLERLSAAAMQSQGGVYSLDGATAAWARALTDCLATPARSGFLAMPSFAPDGRLARCGVPAWLAQRVRDLCGRRHEHGDPGSEWPTGSSLMTEATAGELWRFAEQTEEECRPLSR
jgi:glycosyltransferase involved in cell wall biosynthesis